jgi:hypothetical protein
MSILCDSHAGDASFGGWPRLGQPVSGNPSAGSSVCANRPPVCHKHASLVLLHQRTTLNRVDDLDTDRVPGSLRPFAARTPHRSAVAARRATAPSNSGLAHSLRISERGPSVPIGTTHEFPVQCTHVNNVLARRKNLLVHFSSPTSKGLECACLVCPPTRISPACSRATRISL